MRTVNVLTFGAITEITGNKSFLMDGIESTESLVQILEEKYPLLKTVPYAIAVNKEVIHQHTSLDHNAVVAILPSFSGG